MMEEVQTRPERSHQVSKPPALTCMPPQPAVHYQMACWRRRAQPSVFLLLYHTLIGAAGDKQLSRIPEGKHFRNEYEMQRGRAGLSQCFVLLPVPTRGLICCSHFSLPEGKCWILVEGSLVPAASSPVEHGFVEEKSSRSFMWIVVLLCRALMGTLVFVKWRSGVRMHTQVHLTN